MSKDLDAEFRDIARMDWLYALPRYNKLHAPLDGYDMPHWHAENVTFACGWKVEAANIPGIFSRMSVPRCAKCCDKLGYPRGIGSPKNDDACRVLLGLDVAS
jgi:hypothetical protein